MQNLFNLGDRASEDVLDHCTAEGIGFIPWRPVGRPAVDDDGRSRRSRAAHDATPSQLALAWLLRLSPVMLPIPGTSSVAHLEENTAAAAIELTDDEMAALDRS